MAEVHEIAGYRVVGTLGQGARSTIYEVRDAKNQAFALKHVLKSSPSDQRFIDQALAEHDIAAKFDSPLLRKSHKVIRQRKVIRVSEVAVLMELVHGISLEQRQPKNLQSFCRTCHQAANALSHMHQAGYVHADIKPNNIMVDDKGGVKVIDFGQSCANGTIKERIQGTPDYIAPEQVRRKAITPATDVFNLGATMYWLLTHRHVPTLIPKKSAGVAIKSEDRGKCPPPIELEPATPPALSSLVMECVETDPRKRPASMTHVADRLELAASQLARQNAANGASGTRPGLDDTDVPTRNVG